MAHAHDTWYKKAVWKFRVWLILFDDVNIDVFIFCRFDGKSVALVVAEGEIL